MAMINNNETNKLLQYNTLKESDSFIRDEKNMIQSFLQNNNKLINYFEKIFIFFVGILFMISISYIIPTKYTFLYNNNKSLNSTTINNTKCNLYNNITNEIINEENKLKSDKIELAKIHAILSKERIEYCSNVTWYNACLNLDDANARRHRRQRNLLEDNNNNSVNLNHSYTYIEEALLDSDDPSVIYNKDCLRLYRLDLYNKVTFPYHASQLLRTGGNHTMALFIQHGAMRDADHYYCSFIKLMLKQNYRNFNDILIIAPNFEYKGDINVYPYDAFWNSTKPWGDWRVGAQSDPLCCGNIKGMLNPKTISSFDILDQMLGILTDRKLYPNMNKISIVGHSAGGQMIQRYALMSLLASAYDEDDIDWINMQFIVANPSSYTYLDERRFSYNCGHCSCTSDNCTCPQLCTKPNDELTIPSKEGVGRREWPCFDSDYNSWPYGLSKISDPKHMVPYVIKSGPLRASKMYSKRNMIYLVGQNDTCNDGLSTCDSSCWKRTDYLDNEWPCYRNSMDTRCPAMLEGPYRRIRGIQYMKYLEKFYGKPTHKLYVIPDMGHNATGMFGSEEGLRIIFS